MATGGSIIGLGLAGRNFSVTSDTDSGRNLGGTTNEKEANGDGTSRTIKTVRLWSLTGLTISTDDLQGDQEFIQALANGNEDFDIDIEYVSGAVYSGRGQITGDIDYTNANTATGIELMGGGTLVRQAL